MRPTNPHLPCTCRHQQCKAYQPQCRFWQLCPSVEPSAQVQAQQRMTQVWRLLLSYHLTAQMLWFPSTLTSPSPLFLQALLVFRVTVGKAHLPGCSHVMNSPMFSRQTILSASWKSLWTKASTKCPKCKCEWISLCSLLIMLKEMCIPITSHLVILPWNDSTACYAL